MSDLWHMTTFADADEVRQMSPALRRLFSHWAWLPWRSQRWIIAPPEARWRHRFLPNTKRRCGSFSSKTKSWFSLEETHGRETISFLSTVKQVVFDLLARTVKEVDCFVVRDDSCKTTSPSLTRVNRSKSPAPMSTLMLPLTTVWLSSLLWNLCKHTEGGKRTCITTTSKGKMVL